MAADAEALSDGNGFDPEDDLNERNGIAHAHTSAKWAIKYGQTIAEWLGDQKEDLTGDSETYPIDSWRDQYNNTIGRKIAEWMELNEYTTHDLNPNTGTNYTQDEVDQILDRLILDALHNGGPDIDGDGIGDGEILSDLESDPRLAGGVPTDPVTGEQIDPETLVSWNGPSAIWYGAAGGGTSSSGSGSNWSGVAEPRDYSSVYPNPEEDPVGFALFMLGGGIEYVLDNATSTVAEAYAGSVAAQAIVNAAVATYDGVTDVVAVAYVGLYELASDIQDMLSEIGQAVETAGGWISSAWNMFWAAWNNGSPLVFDLDGDGIELVSLANSNIYWDIDQDGFAEKIGWVQAEDGFLAIDANNDGIVTGHSELFGSVAEDGFTDLRLLDSNSDNVMNASDTAFADLLVWRDLNQNGVSEGNELFTLAALDIVSINLNATAVNQTNQGHDISHVSTYIVDDGVSGPHERFPGAVFFGERGRALAESLRRRQGPLRSGLQTSQRIAEVGEYTLRVALRAAD